MPLLPPVTMATFPRNIMSPPPHACSFAPPPAGVPAPPLASSPPPSPQSIRAALLIVDHLRGLAAPERPGLLDNLKIAGQFTYFPPTVLPLAPHSERETGF